MKASTEVTVVLKLTAFEATWLASIMQNPLYDQSPEEEVEQDRVMREGLWNALHDITEL